MPPSHTSPLMSPSLSNALGMPAYVSCQGMEGLGAPPHAEDEAAPLDEAKAQVRPPWTGCRVRGRETHVGDHWESRVVWV